MKRILVTLLCVLGTALSTHAQINFQDGTSQTTGELSNVITIQAEGTATANGTALKNAMTAISGSNSTPTVIQLAAGTYNLGASTLTLKPFVTVRGVFRRASIITGTAAVIIDGADDSALQDVGVTGSTSGNILFRAQNGISCSAYDTQFMIEVAGGGTAIGAHVLSGSGMLLYGCEFSGESDNSGGSKTVVSVSGTDSEIFLGHVYSELAEASQTGALVGIATSSGGRAEVVGGEYYQNRDTSASTGNAVTGVSIGSGTFVSLRTTTINTGVTTSQGFDNSVAVSMPNDGGLTGFGTLFQGTVPATFFTSSFVQATYSQCSNNFVDL